MGLYGWACVGLCSCAQMARAMAGTDGGHRWRGPWCKGEKKKRHRQRARALSVLIVSHIARGPVHYTKTGRGWPYF